MIDLDQSAVHSKQTRLFVLLLPALLFFSFLLPARAQEAPLFSDAFSATSVSGTNAKWLVLEPVSYKWALVSESGPGYFLSYTPPKSNNFISNTTALTRQGLNLVAGKKYLFTYSVKATGSHELQVLLTAKLPASNISQVKADTLHLAAYSAFNTAGWVQQKHYFVPAVSGTYYFGFHCASPSKQESLNIDEVSIREVFPLQGAYTIGPGGNYTSLPAAVTALQENGVSGPVTFTFTETIFTLSSSVVIPAFQGMSASNPLLFRAVRPGAATLQGNIPGGAVIVVDGAEHVTLEGLSVRNTATTTPTGIQVINGAKNCTLQACQVWADQATSAGARGISVTGIATSQIRLFNNVVRQVSGAGAAFTALSDPNLVNPYGIVLEAGTGHQVYNNSVWMTGLRSGFSSGSAALAVGSKASGLDVRNNILANTRRSSNQDISLNYAVYSLAPASSFSKLDYNLYYSASDNTLLPQALGYLGGAQHLNLAAWKAASKQDGSSMSGEPAFTAADDLSINTSKTNSWYANGTGTHLPGLTTDFKRRSRSTAVLSGGVDLGAYEFSPSAAAPALVSDTLLRKANMREVYSFAGREICAITWGASLTTVPKGLKVFYNPGRNVSEVTPMGGSEMNAYFEILSQEEDKMQALGFTYDFEMYFDVALMGSLDPNNITITKKTHAQAQWETYQDATLDPLTRILKKIKLSSFSYITATDRYMATLPVSLLSFTARKKNQDAWLQWHTALEEENLGFEVEASRDGKTFYKAGFVAGNGTHQGQSYTFTDKGGNKRGVWYYRLKQLDLDGTPTYYGMQAVDFGRGQVQAWAYPNPFTDHLTLSLPMAEAGPALVVLSNPQGQEVKRETISLDQHPARIAVPASSPAGLYFLTVTAAGQTQQIKLLKK